MPGPLMCALTMGRSGAVSKPVELCRSDQLTLSAVSEGIHSTHHPVVGLHCVEAGAAAAVEVGSSHPPASTTHCRRPVGSVRGWPRHRVGTGQPSPRCLVASTRAVHRLLRHRTARRGRRGRDVRFGRSAGRSRRFQTTVLPARRGRSPVHHGLCAACRQHGDAGQSEVGGRAVHGFAPGFGSLSRRTESSDEWSSSDARGRRSAWRQHRFRVLRN